MGRTGPEIDVSYPGLDIWGEILAKLAYPGLGVPHTYTCPNLFPIWWALSHASKVYSLLCLLLIHWVLRKRRAGETCMRVHEPVLNLSYLGQPLGRITGYAASNNAGGMARNVGSNIAANIPRGIWENCRKSLEARWVNCWKWHQKCSSIYCWVLVERFVGTDSLEIWHHCKLSLEICDIYY